MLGHSTISITLDTYSHVLPNLQKEAVRAMEDLIDWFGEYKKDQGKSPDPLSFLLWFPVRWESLAEAFVKLVQQFS